MYLLYFILLIMLLLAITLLAIPFVRNKTFFSKHFFIASIFIMGFSFSIYQLSGNKAALTYWLSQGKEHYRLLTQFEELGGIDGAIQRIQEKLTHHPNDAQAWLILAKLYEAKANKTAAKNALIKAHQLDPSNEQINAYYLQNAK